MSRKIAIILILILGLALRLLLAWTDIETLLQKSLTDDAFYYFVIVRNVVQGRGITFDGLTPTNGFHPLWALLLIPLFAVLRSQPDLAIHASLTMAALFDTATILISYLSVRTLTGDRSAALMSAFLYAYNPPVVMGSVNGLETALATFFFALCFYYYLRIKPKPDVEYAPSSNFGRYALLGLLAGLMVLARLESLLLFAAVWLERLWRLKRREGAPLLIAGGTFVVALLPWLLWNQLTFGTIVQSSSLAAPYMAKYHIGRALEAGLPFSTILNLTAIPASLHMFWRYSGLGWTLLVALLLIWRILKPELRSYDVKAMLVSLTPLFLPLGATLIALFLHTFYRCYPRDWYYVPLSYSVALVSGAIFGHVRRTLSGRLFGPLAYLGLALVMLLQARNEWTSGFYPWQLDMYRSARWIAEHTEPQATIGALNAGIYGYYSDRTVINLDGVTNWPALEAIREQRLLAYAREVGIDYIVDFDFYALDAYSPFFGEGYRQELETVAILSPSLPPLGSIRVYRVLPIKETEG